MIDEDTKTVPHWGVPCEADPVKKDLIEDIKDFHEKFALQPLAKPGFLSEELMRFRMKFLHEEMGELEDAVLSNDLTEVFDALIDIVYVALGTAYLMGLPTRQGWDEVHTSNMAKIRAPNAAASKCGSASDVVKPLGWKKPDLEKILCEVLSGGHNAA